MSRALKAIGLIALCALASACAQGEEPTCWGDIVNNIPNTTSLYDENPVEVEDITDTIRAYHGQRCVEKTNDEYALGIALQVGNGITKFPSWADRGTVIPNGWSGTVAGHDGDIGQIAMGFIDVAYQNGLLRWIAYAAFGDGDRKTHYEFCFTYTVVVWNSQRIDAQVHEPDKTSLCLQRLPGETALSETTTVIEEPAFANKAAVAVVPRVWGFLSKKLRLLQVAYNLDHAEPWAANAPFDPLIGFDRVTYGSQFVYRDDDPKVDVKAGDLAAAIGGNDVRVVQPPFSIVPWEGWGGQYPVCQGLPTTQSAVMKIGRLPFAFAVPVLTGWDLHFACKGYNVEGAGVQINHFTYEDDPSGTGKLMTIDVESMLRDHDQGRQFASAAKVNVLGFSLLPLPDLTVVKQSSNPVDLCRRDASGKLVIGIENVAEPLKAKSKTLVHFQNGVDQVADTMPIGKGQIVNVTVPIPSNCYNPHCPFDVHANRPQQNPPILESNFNNNFAHGECRQ
jgi:hypothetical protein